MPSPIPTAIAMATTTKRRARRRSSTSSAITAAAAATLTVAYSSSSHHHITATATASATWESGSCPPAPFLGWTSNSDCTAYYWCSNGARSSLDYTCPNGQLFDVGSTSCAMASSVACNADVDAANDVVDDNNNNNNNGGGGDGIIVIDEGESDNGMIVMQDQLSQEGALTNNNTDTTTTTAAANTDTIITNSSTTSPTILDLTALQNNPDITLLRGPPIYYPDVPTTTCQSSLNPLTPLPDWMAPDATAFLYSLKQECCHEQFGWMDLPTCLGHDFVETNYKIDDPLAPTSAPSLSPTASVPPSGAPTAARRPTLSPTVTATPSGMPTGAPSGVGSSVPSDVPTGVPTEEPTPAGPTRRPTLIPSAAPVVAPTGMPSSSPVRGSFIVGRVEERENNNDGFGGDEDDDDGLLGSMSHASHFFDSFAAATTTAATTSTGTATTISNINTDKDNTNLISELILPITSDATVSKQRPDLNFGPNPALAIDNGGADGKYEQFDSLLQFDTSLIDTTRLQNIESVMLRLYSLGDCSSGGNFYFDTSSLSSSSSSSVNNDVWNQETLTWNNAPVSNGRAIGTLDREGVTVTAGEWYDVDITVAMISFLGGSRSSGTSGYASIRMTSSSTMNGHDRCLYASMENENKNHAPRVVVKYKPPSSQVPSANNNNDTPPPPLLPMDSVQSLLLSSGDFILLRAMDDATIDAAKPLDCYGHAPILTVQFDATQRKIQDAIIRFDIRQLQNQIPSSAVISLFAETDCESAGTFIATTTTTTTNGEDNEGSWSEEDISWSTAPSTHISITLGTFGSIDAHSWFGFDVVDAVTAAVHAKKEEMTIRVSSNYASPCHYSSIQSGRAPKLLVAFE